MREFPYLSPAKLNYLIFAEYKLADHGVNVLGGCLKRIQMVCHISQKDNHTKLHHINGSAG
jgi:hypothetical protein